MALLPQKISVLVGALGASLKKNPPKFWEKPRPPPPPGGGRRFGAEVDGPGIFALRGCDGEGFSVESIRPRGANPRLTDAPFGLWIREYDLVCGLAKVSLTLSFGGALLHLGEPHRRRRARIDNSSRAHARQAGSRRPEPGSYRARADEPAASLRSVWSGQRGAESLHPPVYCTGPVQRRPVSWPDLQPRDLPALQFERVSEVDRAAGEIPRYTGRHNGSPVFFLADRQGDRWCR